MKHPETGKLVFSCHDVVEALEAEEYLDPEASVQDRKVALQVVGRALAKAYREKHDGHPATKVNDPRETSGYAIYCYPQASLDKGLLIAKAALGESAERAASAAAAKARKEAKQEAKQEVKVLVEDLLGDRGVPPEFYDQD